MSNSTPIASLLPAVSISHRSGVDGRAPPGTLADGFTRSPSATLLGFESTWRAVQPRGHCHPHLRRPAITKGVEMTHANLLGSRYAISTRCFGTGLAIG